MWRTSKTCVKRDRSHAINVWGRRETFDVRGQLWRWKQAGWEAEVDGEVRVGTFNILVNRALGGEGSQTPKPLEASCTYTHTQMKILAEFF